MKLPKAVGRKPTQADDPTKYTPFFAYRPQPAPKAGSGAGVLYCEDTALGKIADAVGTPAYVYSHASIKSGYQKLDRALGSVPHAICYAVKANSNLALLRALARLGSSFDVVSGGELDRLRRIGVPATTLSFPAWGKRERKFARRCEYPGPGIEESQPRHPAFQCRVRAELEVLLGEAQRHVAAGGERPRRRCASTPTCRRAGISTFPPDTTNTNLA